MLFKKVNDDTYWKALLVNLPRTIKLYKYIFVIHFHSGRRLFYWLRNYSTVSLTIPLGDQIF